MPRIIEIVQEYTYIDWYTYTLEALLETTFPNPQPSWSRVVGRAAAIPPQLHLKIESWVEWFQPTAHFLNAPVTGGIS